jgi:hypothetical protein
MGLDVTVRFPAGATPAWSSVREQLARVAEAAPLRMLDGLPAFPDEEPADDWRELRVGLAAGMVALRKSAGALVCTVWSNADAALLAARDRVAWACAAAGQGGVETDGALLSADDFAAAVGIFPA